MLTGRMGIVAPDRFNKIAAMSLHALPPRRPSKQHALCPGQEILPSSQFLGRGARVGSRWCDVSGGGGDGGRGCRGRGGRGGDGFGGGGNGNFLQECASQQRTVVSHDKKYPTRPDQVVASFLNNGCISVN